MISAPEEIMLAEDIAAFTHDPLGCVLYSFPWGEGELEGVPGPRKWQREVLTYIGEHFQNPTTRFQPCLIAISSGHGPGKSTLGAFVTHWGLSTFEDCKIITTANTKTQLDTKTQPEIAKWFRLAINSEWFEVNVSSIKIRDEKHERTWRDDFIPWSEANPQAFAGAHNKGKRIVVLCDESSEIADIIFEVIEGILTDEGTEIILILLGNCTRSTGRFYDACFGRRKARFKVWVLDTREIEGTNKDQIKQWEEDYGEDSDFFRVRVRGLPPRAGSAQFIDMERIQKAQGRMPRSLPDDSLLAGCDFAWGGDDDNVIRFRKGYDGKSRKPVRIKGEFTRDPAIMTNRLADLLENGVNGETIDMLFVDSAGIAGPVVARLRALGHRNVMEVNFGADSPHPKYAYFRDYMWGMMKDWLIEGAIDKDPQLEADLSGPCLIEERRNRVKLEPKELMKKRGLDSPDDGDALALTFAHPVKPQNPQREKRRTGGHSRGGDGWMGM